MFDFVFLFRLGKIATNLYIGPIKLSQTTKYGWIGITAISFLFLSQTYPINHKTITKFTHKFFLTAMKTHCFQSASRKRKAILGRQKLASGLPKTISGRPKTASGHYFVFGRPILHV